MIPLRCPVKKLLFTFVLLLPTLALAQTFGLRPGESITIDFDRLRLLERGGTAKDYQGVAGTATFALHAAGTALTVDLLNTSAAAAAAALYALDLGFVGKLAQTVRATVVAGRFAQDAAWLGPTDNRSVTAGNGNFAFAAREAILGAWSDVVASDPLPPGFLAAGSGGRFTVELNLDPEARGPDLRVRPIMYFVASEPGAVPHQRVRLAAFGTRRGNAMR